MACLVQLLVVAGQDVLVVLLLQGGHGDTDDALLLGRQALLHILDDSAQQVGLQLAMQLRDLRTSIVSLLHKKIPAFCVVLSMTVAFVAHVLLCCVQDKLR